MVTKKPIDKMLTVADVAKILHVHPNTVRRWCATGRMKAYRISPRGDLRFRQEDIVYFLRKVRALS